MIRNKKLLLYVLCLLILMCTFVLIACSNDKISETTSKKNTTVEGQTTINVMDIQSESVDKSSDEYLEKYSKIPVDSSYGEIISSDIYYSEYNDMIMNRITYKGELVKNSFCMFQECYVANLCFDEEKNKWENVDYGPEDLKYNILDENISGEYCVYKVCRLKKNEKVKIQAKIDEWEVWQEEIYGFITIKFYETENNDLEIISEGNMADYKLSAQNICRPENDTKFYYNWEVEHKGFRYTNDDFNGSYIYLLFKTSTHEIFLVQEGDNDDDIFVFKLIKSGVTFDKKVPDFKNMTVSEANILAEENGLELKILLEANSDTVAEGEIISQSIPANTVVPAGTVIDIIVSKGK